MQLNDKIKNLPKTSGVYHFVDDAGKVLYVGKAKNLKNRLRQYFLKELGRGPAIVQMVASASDIKYIETESEIEAVILEAELINKLKPKYNIRQKDDKSFLVIKIIKKNSCVIPAEAGIQTKNKLDPRVKPEDDNRRVLCNSFPPVELVRFKNVDLKDKSADYFGPYPAGEMLKNSLRYLRKIFPFRDCSAAKFRTYQRKNRTCIFGDIRVCSGPCAGWVNEAQYSTNIKYLKNFLRGRKQEVIFELQKEMKKLSTAKKYEEAALVRNRLGALDHIKEVAIGLRDDVFSSEKILFKRIECYDIANIGEEYAVGSMVVFADGKADKDEYRKFKINSSVISSDQRESRDLSKDFSNPDKSGGRNDNNNDLTRLKQVLERRFQNDWPLPDLVVVDGGELQLKIAKEVLRSMKFSIPVISISKGPKRQNNDFHFGDSDVAKYFQGNIPLQNICIAARDEAHRFAISYYRKLHRKDMINK